MFALIDGNSFFCSCERVFRPDLKHMPIVVLSNNDGCVVARTTEAKDMGIKMGMPYYQVRHLVKQGRLLAFSSNYELYADISSRMMQSIASLVPAIEVYSIDECFADVRGMADLRALGIHIRERVWQWVGIPVCIGIAPTKTLAKFCNHLAKRHPNHFNGVVVWEDWKTGTRQRAMASEPVTEVWGIGRRIGKKLAEQQIHTVLDFYYANTALLRKRYGVMVERVQRELHGMACDNLHHAEDSRQNLIRSRSFSKRITKLDPLRSAVCHHISSGAAALRRQGTQAHTVAVFIQTDRFREDIPQYHGYRLTALPVASSDTLLLNVAAQALLEQIYRQGYAYKKCGIELGGIESVAIGAQQDLWVPGDAPERHRLMAILDRINQRFGRQSIMVGSENLSRDWRMNRDLLSPRYTTRFSDLLSLD